MTKPKELEPTKFTVKYEDGITISILGLDRVHSVNFNGAFKDIVGAIQQGAEILEKGEEIGKPKGGDN